MGIVLACDSDELLVAEGNVGNKNVSVVVHPVAVYPAVVGSIARHSIVLPQSFCTQSARVIIDRLAASLMFP